MADSSWLDRVRERLARQLLPPSYVQRFMDELADHVNDLKEENMKAVSRLGDPEQVADTAVAAYRRRSFLGRHPTAAFLVFAISPVVTWCVVALAVLSVLQLFWQGHFNEYFSLIIVFSSIFAAILCGELAVWFGIGKRWTLASCAVLGAIALLVECAILEKAGSHAVILRTVILPVQCAVPLAVGWWFTKQKFNHGHPATTFLVFAISPVVSLMVLGDIARSVVWITQLLLGPHAFDEMPVACDFAIMLLMCVIPPVVASFLYCTLVWRSGIGRQWMIVSCAVLAAFGATQSFIVAMMYHNSGEEHGLLSVGFRMCVILAHFLVPLAFGWWFLRRKHDQGQLQLAS